MMHKIAMALIATASFFFPGCSRQSACAQPKLYIVNVLDKQLFDDAHIKGEGAVMSVQIDYLTDLSRVVAGWDKAVPVVTYCSNSMCTASKDAAKRLIDLGFTSVFAYEGGMAEWYTLSTKDAMYKVEGPAQQAYLKFPAMVPAVRAEGGSVRIITAQELQKMIKQVNIPNE